MNWADDRECESLNRVRVAMARFVDCVALCILMVVPSTALLVGPVPKTITRASAARPRCIAPEMNEDKEFEEWARKKKIAAGIDPDQDFAADRQTESNIFTIGGRMKTIQRTRAANIHSVPECFDLAALLVAAQVGSLSSFPSLRPSGLTMRATSRPSEANAVVWLAEHLLRPKLDCRFSPRVHWIDL